MLVESRQPAIDAATSEWRLSRRGAYNAVHRDIWGVRAEQFSNPWTPTNPEGAINLRLAENNMLHDDIEQFIYDHLRIEKVQHLSYSTGPRGSYRLRHAAARFLENDFRSLAPITKDDIFITPGLTSAVDAIVWSICNSGDGIIIPRPLYNGFKVDVQHRTDAVVVEADFCDSDGYSSLDDVFDPAMNRRSLERAYEEARLKGITVRAVLITNPHNPLGRCYPVETLIEIASFCGEHGCHFVSDEIYARSTFQNPKLVNSPSFISTLSIDLSKYIDPRQHHVLYGASKDFCANGLRLGLVYSKNKGVFGAMSSISPFSWSSHVLQDVWAAMLENDEWRHGFFAKNKRLLADRYKQATAFLRQAGIGYYEMNAGVYVWIDLRPLFVSAEARSNEDYSTLKKSCSACNDHLHRELEIVELCAKNGLHIAPGSSYSAEEFGWFRVTFTTPEAQLKEGLHRLKASLAQLRAEDGLGGAIKSSYPRL